MRISDTTESTVRAMQLIAEEDANLRATRSARKKDMANVRRLYAGGRGMSRRRLVEIYGRDVVDMTLIMEKSK